MRGIVRRRAVDYDVVRPSITSGGRFGENSESTQTISNVSLWVYAPDEINVDTEYGERLGGDLQLLAQPSADIEVQDRITHGTDTYEVEEIHHIPDDADTVLKMASLQRRTNDDSTP